jgi:hypothetical protein
VDTANKNKKGKKGLKNNVFHSQQNANIKIISNKY